MMAGRGEHPGLRVAHTTVAEKPEVQKICCARNFRAGFPQGCSVPRVVGWRVLRYTLGVMSEFVFSPPLKLAPFSTIRTLSEASAYARTCLHPVRRPYTRAGVLRSMSAASTSDEQRFAAKGFRLWAEAEGLVLEK
jgi:hypothetical protein